MKETMYSGNDSLDDQPSLIWVRGDEMRVSTDTGDADPWRDINDPRCENFKPQHWYNTPLDLTRFTDLTVVWERNS